MKHRMTAQAIQDYIAEVELLPATSDDPAVDTIEKRITAATAPNAGSVYRLNASNMGPDVLEDITKLAILLKVYNDKINGSIADIEDERDAIEGILNALEGKDINALAEFVDSAMGQMEYNGVTPFTFVKNKYIPEDTNNNRLLIDSPSDSSLGYCYGILPCDPGDVVRVNGNSYNGSFPRAWYFVKSDYTIIAKEDSNVTVTNKLLTAPLNTAYCVVHARITVANPTITPSYRGQSLADRCAVNRRDLSLYKEGYEPLESGAMVDATGWPATKPFPNRIRTVNYLSLDVYRSAQLPTGWASVCYAYDENYTLCGPNIYNQYGAISADTIQATYPLAKYIRIVALLANDRDANITGRVEWLEKQIVYTRREEGGSLAYPELTAQQKAAIKSLADDYFAARSKFAYLTSATINDYVSKTRIDQNDHYKICCSLLAQMIWMGRSIDDFPDDIDEYTNDVTREFGFGYYFDFVDRDVYGLTGDPVNTYYGFRNPFNDTENYKGSYSFNSYYSGANTEKKQSFNQFLFANDMAKECDRRGYTIPVSELQTGDLLFIKRPVIDQQNNTFAAIAYKNITHVAMVYDRNGDDITIIESTSGYDDPILLCSSTDEEGWKRARVAYLMSNVVMAARHPFAFGTPTNVPTKITSK